MLSHLRPALCGESSNFELRTSNFEGSTIVEGLKDAPVIQTPVSSYCDQPFLLAKTKREIIFKHFDPPELNCRSDRKRV